ncbi:MAG: hypothetical protein CSA70_09905 [Rhodobacterales bacterium]|nr:MAG: hypothetical protein CSA70_09905 [Rhodobacterales bacterium]
MSQEELTAIARLTQEVERLNTHRFVAIHNSVWRLLLFQFSRGLAFGLGSVLGATILVSLLLWWLAQFEFIPIVGDWTRQIIEWIENTRAAR